jgi:HD-GYP domain-containing protein (c-di-GMP phosphodiesterase class II)
MTLGATASVPPELHVKQLEDELKNQQKAITCAFMHLLDVRDIETGTHSTRLAEWAVLVAERLGLSMEQLEDVETAALLHDLGKIGITDSILRKPDRLTDAEMDELRKHPEYGWAILRRVPGFERAALLILHHHERIDGRGYPAGLYGEEIPLGSRIVSVIDAFDAMVSHRCYREGLPLEEAVRRLRESAGSQFDAAIVEEFAQIVEP